MPNFNGQLNQNEIFAALYNMIISQQVFADNIADTKSTLADLSRVDGSLYGDTKLYYSTDVLKSFEWTGDAEKMLKSRIVVESLLKDRNITVTPEEIEKEMENIAEKSGVSVEEVKKHYADPRSKEYLIDDTKEQKLYSQLFAEVKVTKGDKIAFADLFKR